MLRVCFEALLAEIGRLLRSPVEPNGRTKAKKSVASDDAKRSPGTGPPLPMADLPRANVPSVAVAHGSQNCGRILIDTVLAPVRRG